MAVGGSQASRSPAHVKRVQGVKFGTPQWGCRWPAVGWQDKQRVNTGLRFKGVAPASITRTTVAQECCIAIECITLTALKMLHWLAGAKQPDGLGKYPPSRNAVAFFN